MKRRGSSMATALVVVSLLLALGFTAAGMSTSTLTLSSRSLHAQTAKNLAEAAVSRALAELLGNPAYAQPVTVKFASAPDACGNLSFDVNVAPHSTNNLSSDSSAPGWGGTVVPGQAVHLVGVGQCAGIEHRIEVVLFLSRFPYAVASSGPIYSTGGLSVCAVDDPSVLADGADKLPADKRRPGALVSNSKNRKPGEAVSLEGPGIEITGDVQAVGDVKLGSTVSVGGEVRPGSEPAVLPKIDITTYDTKNKPGVVDLPQANVIEPLKISGYARIDRALTAGQGIQLDNGVLYVDGDLTVQGAISGTGAVIVTGKTHVSGRGAGTQGGQTALLSRGDVELLGQATERQSFQGLIYTEGDLSSRFLDLAGVFVANKRGAEGSEVHLEDTGLQQLPESRVQFKVGVPGAPAVVPSPPGGTQLALGAVTLGVSKVARLVLDPAKMPRLPNGAFEMPPDVFRVCSWEITGPPAVTIPATGVVDDLQSYAEPGFSGRTLRALEGPFSQLSAVALQEYIEGYNAQLPSETPTPQDSPVGGGTTGGGTTEQWSLDLSKFIQTQDRIRVLVWRDI